MKKILFFFLLSACFFCQAQNTSPGKEIKSSPEVIPPEIIKEKFTKEYPAITPSWRMEGQNFRADFVDPTTLKGNSIVYDKDGNILRRENEMENASYPQTINDYYIKHFPGEKFKTWTSHDNSGQRMYYIKRDQEIVWFDKDGNYIPPAKK